VCPGSLTVGSAIDDGVRLHERQVLRGQRERHITERRQRTGNTRGELGDGVLMAALVVDRPAVVDVVILLLGSLDPSLRL